MLWEKFKDLIRRHTPYLSLRRTIQRWTKRVWSRLLRPMMIGRYVRSTSIRKLQIGAGRNLLDGWLNTDLFPVSGNVVFLDATKAFPFPGSTFDYAISEHQIEHITYYQALFMLGEIFRVLKPGGRIRIATPDLQVYIELYAFPNDELRQTFVKWSVDRYYPKVGIYRAPFVINNAFYNHGHRFLYDKKTLQDAMEQVGFTTIQRYTVGDSNDDNLRGVEAHYNIVGSAEMNRFETLILEGERPISDKI
jgi:predicted SAM-dependent methyltransferase